MLNFSTQNRQTNSSFKDLNFQPIIIVNSLPKQTSPRKQQKIIFKANTNKSKQKTNSKKKSNQKVNIKQINNPKWLDAETKLGTFDKKLKKNELAQQQRRIKYQIKKQKELIHQQIVLNQKNIKKKNLSLQAEKDQEIQYLKKMIEMERLEKIKNDRLYQQKKLQIEKERQELLQIQKKIQKEGLKSQKVVKQIKKIEENTNTQNNYKKQNKQPLKKYQTAQNKKAYEQPTQSQVLHQKNKIREQQLAYLINQRQKRLSNTANINYSSTLIPLLSKASYKIISTHVSSLVELFIDDLLQEQVYLLEKIQLEQRKQKQIKKQKQLLNDYYNQLEQFVNQNDEIANKIGNYSTMNFTNLYKPKHYPKQIEQKSKNNNHLSLKVKLNLEFDNDQMQQIQNRKDKFIRFVSNFDQYEKRNIKMFQDVTEELIQQAILKLAKQLDKGSSQFVDIVFRNEFN